MHKSIEPDHDPITVSVGVASRMSGVGRTTINEAIRNGMLDSTTVGRRRLVTVASLKRFLSPTKRRLKPRSPARHIDDPQLDLDI